MRFRFLLVLLATFLSDAVAAQKTEGLWLGTLQADKVGLRLVLHFNSAAPELAGTLDIIEQGVTGLPVSSITREGTAIKFRVDKITASFEGTVGGSEITGSWSQSGYSFPLAFKHTDTIPDTPRPQDPKKPYPYNEEAVTFLNSKAGIHFTGALTLPRTAEPAPAVLLIGGAGPHDHNGTVFGHKPFLILADYLTRKGIAVLRVDDRGVGGSGGKINQGVQADLVSDALSGVTFLKSRKEIDSKRIGLIGSNEGGLVAALVTSQSSDISFVVLMATAGLPGEQILGMQSEILLQSMKAPPEILESNRALQQLAFDTLRKEKDDQAAFRKIVESASSIPLASRLFPLLETQIKATNMPWLREWLVSDPRQILAKVKAPLLAIHGEHDLETPSRRNLDAIAKALESGGNPDYAIVKLPGLNHLFQTSKDGARTEYFQIEETIAPAALETIGAWIAAHARPQP